MRAAAFTTFRLAEVDTAGQLAHAQNIETFRGDIGAQRTKSFQPLVERGGTQVAEQFEMLAQRQQRATLRLRGGRQMLPFGAADRAEKDGVGLLAACDGGGRQRFAVAVDGDAANVILAGGNAHIKAVTNGVQHFHGLRHDFGADAVAGQYCDMRRGRHSYTVSF